MAAKGTTLAERAESVGRRGRARRRSMARNLALEQQEEKKTVTRKGPDRRKIGEAMSERQKKRNASPHGGEPMTAAQRRLKLKQDDKAKRDKVKATVAKKAKDDKAKGEKKVSAFGKAFAAARKAKKAKFEHNGNWYSTARADDKKPGRPKYKSKGKAETAKKDKKPYVATKKPTPLKRQPPKPRNKPTSPRGKLLLTPGKNKSATTRMKSQRPER